MRWTTVLMGLGLLGLLVLHRARDIWQAWIPIEDPDLDLILNFLIIALAGRLIVRVIVWWYRRRKSMHPRRIDTFILGMHNIYYLLLAGLLVLTVLGFYGIDVKTLFTTLSIVAAAIAIISKDYISEIISGIIISFSNELTIDDYIKIGEHRGKVMDLTLTKVALLNEDDDVIYIPNNKVYSNEVVNYTKRAIRRVTIEFELPFQSLKTVDDLEQDLIESLSEFADYIVADSYTIRIGDIRKDSLSLKFQYTLKTQRERELERDIRKRTVRRIVNHVKRGIVVEANEMQTDTEESQALREQLRE